MLQGIIDLNSSILNGEDDSSLYTRMYSLVEPELFLVAVLYDNLTYFQALYRVLILFYPRQS